jgi:hypothetical protein
MKRALSHIALLLFVLFAAHVSVHAQEGPDNEQPIFEEKVYHESPVNDMDGETDNKILTPTVKSASRDSSAVRIILPTQRVPNKTNQDPSKDNKSNPQQAQQSGDDSILSFNFIYYIIQRFKLQDIIE